MAKSVLDAMKHNACAMLESMPLDVISVSDGESTDKDSGVVTSYQRYEVEVPKGYDDLSRCRFTVKVLGGKVLLTEKDLSESYYSVSFKGLAVSFISEKGAVYFRAEEAVVKKEE